MSRKITDVCQICGDRAKIINYGALSCSSCKTFFRRHGFYPDKTLSCKNDHKCEINLLTRRTCTMCRLKKCFSVGMCSDLIRKEDLYGYRKSRNLFSVQTKDLLINDRSLLTTIQWTLLSNIIYAFDTYSCLSKLQYKINQLSIFKQEKFDPFEIFRLTYTSTREFIQSIPDFQVLCVNEQQHLFQRNLSTTSSFCATLFFRDSNLLDNIQCFNTLSAIYGIEVVEQVRYSMKYLDSDPIVWKLMILVISFSSTCTLNIKNQKLSDDNFTQGTYQLFASQNIYVEILWKYMIYRYGYLESTVRYSKFIKYMLDKIKQLSNVYENNNVHYQFVNEIVNKFRQSLVIDQNRPVSLWGRTVTTT